MRVDLAYANGHVDITVDDDGRGIADALTGGRHEHGHGLIGMRERAALYDGRLEAGPGPDGGFRVHARLPVDPAARA